MRGSEMDKDVKGVGRSVGPCDFLWPGHYWLHCSMCCNRRTNGMLCTVD
jgi:hypothetical protein